MDVIPFQGDDAGPMAAAAADAPGHVQVFDHQDLPQQQVHRGLDGPVVGDKVRGPAQHALFLGRVLTALGPQVVQGEEGGPAPAGAFEVVDGGLGVVPGFHDHVLQAAAQGDLDGLLQVVGDVEQGGDGADDAPQFALMAGPHHLLHPGVEALALGPQAIEQVVAGLQLPHLGGEFVALALQTGLAHGGFPLPFLGPAVLLLQVADAATDLLQPGADGVPLGLQLGDAGFGRGDLLLAGRDLLLQGLALLLRVGDAAFPFVDGCGQFHEPGPGLVQRPLRLQTFGFQGLECGLGLQQVLLALVTLLVDGVERGAGFPPAGLFRPDVLGQQLDLGAEPVPFGLQRPDALLGNGLFPFQLGPFRFQGGQLPPPLGQLGPQFGLFLAQGRGLAAVLLDAGVGAGDDLFPVSHRGAGVHQLAHGLMPAIPIPDPQKLPQFGADLVVLDGFFRLFFQLFQPGFDLGDDVPHPGEVVPGLGQAVLGQPPLGAIVGDARGLLEEDAAVFGPLGQDLGHHALADDGVGAAAQARTVQQLVHVLQADAAAVDVVFVFARAVGAAGDEHFVEVDGQPVVAVVQQDADFGHAHAGPLVGPGEDHVFGFLAPQHRVGLFAHDPADGVGDVAFAAAVGAHDGGDVAVEDDFGGVGEGFIAVQGDFL